MTHSGILFDIKHFAVHDGPGIRTTIFLKGCPLRCQWCHNPESISEKPQLLFTPTKCIHCGYCFETCPNGVHSIVNEKHIISWNQCSACGLCTNECYSGTLEIVGKTVSVKDVIEEVLKDRVFYKNSEGGLTVSGGEPLAQPLFTRAILFQAKLERIHTALDTSGFAPWKIVRPILDFVDLVLYDVKHFNSMIHLEFTGVPNEVILENLKKIDQMNKNVWIRAPLIPGVNDSDENFHLMGTFLSALNNVERIDLLRYHRLAESKYMQVGMDYRLKGLLTPKKENVEHLREILLSYGLSKIYIN